MNFTQHHFKQSFKFFGFIVGLFLSAISFLKPCMLQAQEIAKDSLSNFNTNLLLVKPLISDWSKPENWKSTVTEKSDCELVETGLREKILQYSLNFLGIRYRSSGKSPKIGFDCSGFTGFVFRNFGMRLKASSPAQAMEGKKVPVNKATIGDLAFFGKKGRMGRLLVNHAAIVISKPGEPLSIIHSASNKGIVITKVDESRYWKNSLLFVRNVL